MVRGRYNRITRTVGLALAALFAFAVPLASGDALAADTTAKTEPAKVDKAPAKKAKKRGPTAKKSAVAASGKKPSKPTKSPETSTASTTQAGGKGAVQAKHTAPKASGEVAATTTASVKKPVTTAPAKGKPATKQASKTATGSAASTRTVGTSKKASTRAPGAKRKTGKKAEADAERPPCFAPAVAIDRNGLENETFSLVDCKGKPLDSAREKLSILARPWGTARPVIEPPKKKKATKGPAGKDKPAQTVAEALEIAPNVRLLDPGLLTRVDRIARHFPGKHISLVSGYRPRSRGSLHQTARAIDMRVAGVSNEEVVAFCKTITDTGCGYYPNSSFVHIDVRAPGTGSVSWIDASGPGEAPRYVSAWPPPPEPKAPDADVHDGATAEGIEDEVMREATRSGAGASGTTPAPSSGSESRPVVDKEADPKDPVPVAPTNPAPAKSESAPKETAPSASGSPRPAAPNAR